MDDDDDDLLLACSMAETEPPEILRSTHKKSIKVSSSFKKQDTWIAPSFGDFGDLGASTGQKKQPKTCTGLTSEQPRKRTKVAGAELFPTKPNTTTQSSVKKTKSQKNSGDLWADKYHPTCQADLAVHKKKIGELQDWLQHSLRQTQKHAPILLLTGPAGSGKTATLRVLAQEMAIEVKEWTNPVADVYDNSDRWKTASEDFRPVGGSVYVSQTAQFQDFLLRANRYPSLQIFNQDQLHRKIILVEDFPNIFFKNTSQFHDILRSYRCRGHGPLVFIVSDSAGGESNERLLFPKDVQSDLCIANISFNPVAPTSLSKILTKLATEESLSSGTKLRVPSKATVDSLCAASAGDIRGAINALQFACLKDTRDLDDLLTSSSNPPTSKKSTARSRKNVSSTKLKKQTSLKKKQSADEDSGLAAIGGRDTSLFLFRALGKILYCKQQDNIAGVLCLASGQEYNVL